MTRFTFRASKLYASLVSALPEETVRAIDNNAKTNGGDLVAAIEAHARRLEQLAEQYEGYNGPAARAQAAEFHATLAVLRSGEIEDDACVDAGAFRSAYWIAADGQSDVLLTTEEQAGLADEDLLAAARGMAEEVGLEIGDGRIVIGTYRR